MLVTMVLPIDVVPQRQHGCHVDDDDPAEHRCEVAVADSFLARDVVGLVLVGRHKEHARILVVQHAPILDAGVFVENQIQLRASERTTAV